MTTSKSPRKVATEALAVAEKVFPRFAHRFAPKVYTQPQLFACLVLKSFFKADYRGIWELLLDLSLVSWWCPGVNSRHLILLKNPLLLAWRCRCVRYNALHVGFPPGHPPPPPPVPPTSGAP